MQRIDGCKIKMAVGLDVVKANIDRNSERGLPLVVDCGDWREAMPIAIVGSGPSLRDTLPTLRRFKHVMAAGSSHDWLVSRGVYPSWTVACDPDPVMANYLRKPAKGCKYLISSMCDDAVFRGLEGHDIYLWDVKGSKQENALYDGRTAVMVGGGATVGTRAMVMAMFFGYWNLHLFGFDNCIWGKDHDDHHCFGEFTDPSEKLLEVERFRIGGPEGREFVMAGYMLAQLFDVKTLLDSLGNRMRVTVHGDGALAEWQRISQLSSGEIYEKDRTDGVGGRTGARAPASH